MSAATAKEIVAQADEACESFTPVIKYSVSEASIAELRDKYAGLVILKPSDYEVVRSGIAEIRGLRGDVEKARKEYKADALEYGRRVDAEAKRITSLLEDIEDPLKAEKLRIDDEKARVKREKEEAERAKIEAELAAKRAAEEAEAARIKAEKDAAENAERDRIAAEQAAENARLAEERKKLEAERAAAEAERAKAQAIRDEEYRVEREKIEAERKAVEDEKRRIAQEEFERQAKEKAEREAREKVEREAAEAKAAAERAEADRIRLEALRPDKEKLAAFGKAINRVEQPNLSSAEADAVLSRVNGIIWSAIEEINEYCGEGLTEAGCEATE
jgi:chromosome segregation ATPase